MDNWKKSVRKGASMELSQGEGGQGGNMVQCRRGKEVGGEAREVFGLSKA